MDRVDRALQSSQNLEAMMRDVLDTLLAVLACDRACLLYPCDPDAGSWRVAMERARPELPGLPWAGAEFPMAPEAAGCFALMRAAEGPLVLELGAEAPYVGKVATRPGPRTQLSTVLYLQESKPWLLGLQPGAEGRVWTAAERRLFQEVGGRMAGALTSRLAFRKLQESEARYRRITEGLTDYLYSVRVENGRAVQTTQSPACATVTGYTPEEYAADPYLWFRMIVPEDRELVLERVRQVLAGVEIPPIEHRIVRKDGAMRWVCDTTILFRDGAGRIQSYDGVIKDITDRKLAEEALWESKQRLEITLEATRIGSWDWDLKTDTWHASPIYYAMLGYEPVQGPEDRQLWLSRIHPEDREAVAEKIRRLRSGESEEYQYEARIQHADGSYRWHQVIGQVIERGDGGKPTRLIGVRVDNTDRKRLESEYRQAQKMEAFGQLAGGVAHDFNNILTVIQGNATLLEMGAFAAAEQPNALRQITEAAERASRLTRQLLLFSRRQAVQLGELDLNEVVLNMTRMLQRLIGEHISLVAHYAPGQAPIHADAGMMEQVLMNLAVNSRDAMPGGGELCLQTEIVSAEETLVQAHSPSRAGKFVRLSVSDTGCGIAPQHLAHIFEPFYTTKDVGKGTGLGLATVFGIVQQHQGWVTVDSRVGAGTVFRIFLPLLERRPCAATEGRTLREERGGRETLLLVEDEPALRSLVGGVLERQGYRVYAAASAIAALSVWLERRDEIALLLTDMVMPGGMSGWELGKRLQAEKPALKVIYSTGYTDEMLGEASALRGAPNFLEKPYDPVEVLRKVRAGLDAR